MEEESATWYIARCSATTTLSEAKQAAIDAVDDGECPSEPTTRCSLIGGHSGPHHAHVQTSSRVDCEMWLVWSGEYEHQFHWLPVCTLRVPMVEPGYVEPENAGTSCFLFHGHQGAHDLGGGRLWWWGDRQTPFAGPMRNR